MADPIQEVLQAFAHGELVVVTDDEDREGEGDLIVAATLCTAEKMAFIIRHTSGIVCVPITGEDARRLRLDPMVAHNEFNHTTAFTVSIDYKPDGGTGISADERAPVAARWPIRMPAPRFRPPRPRVPADRRDGGVLLRSGHTEAAVDLCKLSGLPPVGVISESMNDDGTVMKGEQVARFAAADKLKHVTIADMICLPLGAREIDRVGLDLHYGSPIGPSAGLRLIARRSTSIAHVAFVYNGIGDGKNVLTRFHKPNIVRDTLHRAEADAGRARNISGRPAAARGSDLRDGAVGSRSRRFRRRNPPKRPQPAVA